MYIISPAGIKLGALIFIGIFTGIASAQPSPTMESVVDQSRQRAVAIFKADAGKPLKRAKKGAPISKGRPPFTRDYSYSIMEFSARCYVLNEMLDEANAAMQENCRFYIEKNTPNHDRDSFQLHGEIMMRLIEMYGAKGQIVAGRMTPETEKLIMDCCWEYASKAWMKKAAHDEKSIWHSYGSENHHSMDFTINWHFAKLAKDHPDFKNRKWIDGSTAEQQYQAWSEYFIAYAKARAKKSMCAEMRSDGYNTTLIKGFYNFHDFGDPKVKAAAAMLLDLYFAYWAEEQINGHMGGGASRMKGNNAYVQSRNGKNAFLAWLYFGMGESPKEVHGHDIAALTSSYHPPAVIADIALDSKGRGVYEIRQRAQGAVIPNGGGNSFPVATANEPPTKLLDDGGGIVRYSYCTPDFILGTPMSNALPMNAWAGISSQSRAQGLIFALEDDPRIVPIVRPKDNRVAFNTFWSVQSKGTLISQKLKGHKGGAEMIVFISERGLPEPVEKGDTVFVDAGIAYAAIRIPIGGWQWRKGGLDYTAETGEPRKGPVGRVLELKEEFAPVILEVMSKEQAGSFAEFQKRVMANKPKLNGKVLSYQSLYGDVLTLDTSYKNIPTINGEPVNYEPKMVYDSPFLQSVYDSGIVTIQKGSRKRVLNFNELTVSDSTK